MTLNVTIAVCMIIQDGSSCLYVATESGRTQVVDVLLKRAANPNQVTVVRVGSLLSNILLNVKFVQYMYQCDYTVIVKNAPAFVYSVGWFQPTLFGL